MLFRILDLVIFIPAEEVLTSLGALHKRLTFTQFRVYIDQLTEDMIPQEFDEFADYLIASVEVKRYSNN